MPRKRDRSFLIMAGIAGTGGVLAICCSIGIPIWMHLHGQPYTPAFSLFAAWGIFAIIGGCACLHTYNLTDPLPPRPPGGGMPLTVLKPVPPAVAASRPMDDAERIAA
jgi:hypothetical protein